MSLQKTLCQFISIKYTPAREKCEDALCYSFEDMHFHFVGVFDGCGGLGSKRYEKVGNKTGAFISSQTCALVFHDEMKHSLSNKGINDSFVTHLKSSFLTTLRNREKQYGQQSKLIGTMVRTLPCTGSMIVVSQAKSSEKLLHLDIIHAGDSRIYIMRPNEGLQQVTRDELSGNPDALKNLYVNAPITNVINIDKDFMLTHLSYDIDTPFAVLCASDGVFGYVKTPMHFEKIILDALESSNNFDSAEQHFLKSIKAITADDSTAVMPFYGWDSFEQIKSAFAKRHRFISGLCRSIEEDMTDETINSAWNQFKVGYYWDGESKWQE